MLAVEANAWINTAIGIGVLLGGVGYAVGQFYGSRSKGQSDALDTALNEIAAEKIAKERLALIATEKTADLGAARAEVVTLRAVLASGATAAPEIIEKIDQALAACTRVMIAEQEKTRKVIQDLMDSDWRPRP